MGAIGADQELDRAGARVAGGAGECDGGFGQGLAGGVGDGGRGRLLDHLLVAPLEAALALPEGDRLPAVAEHLHLDVASGPDQLFEEEPPIAEGPLGLAPCGGECRRHLLGGGYGPHALAAAPACRLEERPDSRGAGAALAAASGVSHSAAPGMTGTPAFSAAAREARFSPRVSIACGEGPMNTSPAFATASANAALWERKP